MSQLASVTAESAKCNHRFNVGDEEEQEAESVTVKDEMPFLSAVYNGRTQAFFEEF